MLDGLKMEGLDTLGRKSTQLQLVTTHGKLSVSCMENVSRVSNKVLL